MRHKGKYDMNKPFTPPNHVSFAEEREGGVKVIGPDHLRARGLDEYMGSTYVVTGALK